MSIPFFTHFVDRTAPPSSSRAVGKYLFIFPITVLILFSPIRDVYISRPTDSAGTVFMAGISYTAPMVTRSLIEGNVPNDPDFSKQDYLLRTNALKGWTHATDANKIIVAVIDSGVDIDHPDLVENIWVNNDEIPGNGIDDDHNGYIDDVHGWDFITQSSDPRPKIDSPYVELGVNHGTIVAGVLAARGNNGIGVTGTAWKTRIMPLRVLDGMGEGLTDNVAKAILYAVDNGARVINLSFVGHDSSISMTEAIQKAWKAGVFVTAASGNEVREGINLDEQPAYPVCQDGPPGENWVFGVTSIDHADRLASFSNYGSRCIDVAAPGVSIYSTLFYRYGTDFDQYYSGWWSGTSVAAPQVSALAALIWSINPDLTLRQVQDIIKEESVDIDAANTSLGGLVGQGKIDLAITLTKAGTVTPVQADYPRPSSSPAPSLIIVAPKGGNMPEVIVFGMDAKLQSRFSPYNSQTRVGVNIATGDLDGDGSLDIVTAPGKGSTPQINIFSLDGKLKSSFLAYAPTFTAGVRVAVGDVDGDGFKEIITGPLAGGGPHVRIFDFSGNVKGQFFAYPEHYRYGIDVATLDIDGDGIDELMTSPGPGIAARLRIFNNKGLLRRELLVFPDTFVGGAHISRADFDANGIDEIAVAAARGGGPQVRIINDDGTVLNQFFVYQESFRGGVELATGDLNNDGRDELIVSPESAGSAHIRVFSPSAELQTQFFAYPDSVRGGFNVASGS